MIAKSVSRFSGKIMRGKDMRLAVAFLLISSGIVSAQTHHCAKDAIARSRPLLELHFETKPEGGGTIDDKVKVLPPIKALKGNGKLDVLETWGYIYKAEYRMRFIYAQIKDSCLLMGQEILESANPY